MVEEVKEEEEEEEEEEEQAERRRRQKEHSSPRTDIIHLPDKPHPQSPAPSSSSPASPEIPTNQITSDQVGAGEWVMCSPSSPRMTCLHQERGKVPRMKLNFSCFLFFFYFDRAMFPSSWL